jgi:hypothetical protein
VIGTPALTYLRYRFAQRHVFTSEACLSQVAQAMLAVSNDDLSKFFALTFQDSRLRPQSFA